MKQQTALRLFGRYASLNILGQAGISCYILADTFFVSRGMGATGLAALNIVLPLYNLMNGIGLMIGVGSATHFTICRAQGQQKDADRAFTHAAGLGLAAGVFFLLLGLLAAGPLARLLGADAETYAQGSVYLRTLLSFGPFFVMNNVMLAFGSATTGGPGRAMCGMVVGSLSNVVMDYVFIFPLGMGMFGAALATGVSPLISLLILSGHLRAPERGFHLLRTRPRLRLLPALCTPGLPSLISELSSGRGAAAVQSGAAASGGQYGRRCLRHRPPIWRWSRSRCSPACPPACSRSSATRAAADRTIRCAACSVTAL